MTRDKAAWAVIYDQYRKYVQEWGEQDWNDARRWRVEFLLAWLTVVGKRGAVDKPTARQMYRYHKSRVTGIDTELLRILIDDIGATKA